MGALLCENNLCCRIVTYVDHTNGHYFLCVVIELSYDANKAMPYVGKDVRNSAFKTK